MKRPSSSHLLTTFALVVVFLCTRGVSSSERPSTTGRFQGRYEKFRQFNENNNGMSFPGVDGKLGFLMGVGVGALGSFLGRQQRVPCGSNRPASPMVLLDTWRKQQQCTQQHLQYIKEQRALREENRRRHAIMRTIFLVALAGCTTGIVISDDFRSRASMILEVSNQRVFLPVGEGVKAALVVLLGAALSIVGAASAALLIIFEKVLEASGPVLKWVGSAGLVAFVAVATIAIVIAFPTLQEYGRDMQGELHNNYRAYKRERRMEQGYPTVQEYVRDLQGELQNNYRAYKQERRMDRGYPF